MSFIIWLQPPSHTHDELRSANATAIFRSLPYEITYVCYPNTWSTHPSALECFANTFPTSNESCKSLLALLQQPTRLFHPFSSSAQAPEILKKSSRCLSSIRDNHNLPDLSNSVLVLFWSKHLLTQNGNRVLAFIVHINLEKFCSSSEDAGNQTSHTFFWSWSFEIFIMAFSSIKPRKKLHCYIPKYTPQEILIPNRDHSLHQFCLNHQTWYYIRDAIHGDLQIKTTLHYSNHQKDPS